MGRGWGGGQERIAKKQSEHNLKNIFSKILIVSSLKPLIFVTFISATFIKSVIFEYSHISAN